MNVKRELLPKNVERETVLYYGDLTWYQWSICQFTFRERGLFCAN
jgi:hypothetical protein